MIKAIEVNGKEFHAIWELLPDELKEKLKHVMQNKAADEGIEKMKEFISQYDDEDPVDHIIGFTCGTVISRIGQGIGKAIKRAKREGKKGINGHDAAQVTIAALRKEADKIESALKHHQECDHCSDDCEEEDND